MKKLAALAGSRLGARTDMGQSAARSLSHPFRLPVPRSPIPTPSRSKEGKKKKRRLSASGLLVPAPFPLPPVHRPFPTPQGSCQIHSVWLLSARRVSEELARLCLSPGRFRSRAKAACNETPYQISQEHGHFFWFAKLRPGQPCLLRFGLPQPDRDRLWGSCPAVPS